MKTAALPLALHRPATRSGFAALALGCAALTASVAFVAVPLGLSAQGEWAMRGAQSALIASEGPPNQMLFDQASACEAQARGQLRAENPAGFAATAIYTGSPMTDPAGLRFLRDVARRTSACVFTAYRSESMSFSSLQRLADSILTARFAQAQLQSIDPSAAAEARSPAQIAREETAVDFIRAQNEAVFDQRVQQNARWLNLVSQMCSGVAGKARCSRLWLSGRDMAEKKALFAHPERAVDFSGPIVEQAALVDRQLWRIDHADQFFAAQRANFEASAGQSGVASAASDPRDGGSPLSDYESARRSLIAPLAAQALAWQESDGRLASELGRLTDPSGAAATDAAQR
jgi:hypothetical protein